MPSLSTIWQSITSMAISFSLDAQTTALLQRIAVALEAIETTLKTMESNMALDFTALTASVTQIDNEVAAAVTAFQAIAAALANNPDQATVAQIATDLAAHASALAAAIPANTTPAPAPATPPPTSGTTTP